MQHRVMAWAIGSTSFIPFEMPAHVNRADIEISPHSCKHHVTKMTGIGLITGLTQHEFMSTMMSTKFSNNHVLTK